MTPKIQICKTVDKAQKIIIPEYCKYNGNRNTALIFDLSDSKKEEEAISPADASPKSHLRSRSVKHFYSRRWRY